MENLHCRAEWQRLLSPEETGAAARFLREEDRERYVVAHGVLRELLGRYLEREPGGLEFRKNEFGKPILVLEGGFPKVAFNLAHSGDVIAVAVAINRRVGVDVEKVRPNRDLLDLARAQFADDEVLCLEGMAVAEREAAFYRGWTLKEAYVKARGEGLGYSLRNFSVTVRSDEAPAVKWAVDDPHADCRWSAFILSPGFGYAGALVAEGRSVQVSERSWGRG